jgi:hypothetical protein
MEVVSQQVNWRHLSLGLKIRVASPFDVELMIKNDKTNSLKTEPVRISILLCNPIFPI